MKRSFLLTLLAIAFITLALGGWLVQGVRWTLSGTRRPRGRVATA